jgi:hypothetical protein
MGCKESTAREPRPTHVSASDPSVHCGLDPRKSAESVSNGAVSVSNGCVEDGCLLERPTGSTSQCAATPTRSHRSRSPSLADGGAACAGESQQAHGSSFGGDGDDINEGRKQEAEVPGTCEQRGGATEVTGSHASAVTPRRPSVEWCPSSPPQQPPPVTSPSTRGGTPHSKEKPPAASSSPLACLAALAVRSTPTPTGFPKLAAPAAVAPPSLVAVSEAAPPPPLLLPPPAYSTAGELGGGGTTGGSSSHDNDSTVRSSSGPVRELQSSGAADVGSSSVYVRGDLGDTSTTLNSTSLLRTLASTQPPSMHASRSASVQPALPSGTTSATAGAGTSTTPLLLSPGALRKRREDETEEQRTPHFSSVNGGTRQKQQLQSEMSTPTRSLAVRFQPVASSGIAAESIDGPAFVPSQASPRVARAGVEPSSHSGHSVCLNTTTTTSDKFSSTVDGRSTAPTQPPSATATGTTTNPHLNSTIPPTAATPTVFPLPLQRQQHTRSFSGPVTTTTTTAGAAAASPRPRIPLQLVSPQLSREATSPTPSAAGAVATADGSDAPHEVPLPEIVGFFAMSPTQSSSALPAATQGSSLSGGDASPCRRGSGSPGLHSLAAPLVVLTDGEGYNSYAHLSASAAPTLTSPFTTHGLSYSTHSSSLNGVSGNTGWLTGCNTDGGVGTGGAAVTANCLSTPPTTSELVRQINQPTTNIKSILRKRASSATAAAQHGAGTDADRASTTALGASAGAHSRVLSLSLTNAGGSAPSPRLTTGDGRVASLSEAALRTDFIMTRYSTSDIDTVSPLRAPLLTGLSPSPRGGKHKGNNGGSLRSPPTGSFSVNGGLVGRAPLTLSAEASLGGTATSVSNSHAAKSGQLMEGGDSPPYGESGKHGQSRGVGGHPSVSSNAASLRSPRTPGAPSPRRSDRRAMLESPNTASFNATRGTAGSAGGSAVPVGGGSALSGSIGAASDLGFTSVGRTSDNPPPDIVLASPPKRVHLIV